MIDTLIVYRPTITDPWRNLALEEVLFDDLDEATLLAGVYRNTRCLVIGKHQNPWREIDVGVARDRDVPIIRRITGGGTVYHDDGNLCFTFMSRRDALDRVANLTVVQHALAHLGVDATITGTFDLFASERKISGNSFCFRRQKGMHHGTILVDSDRTLMRQLLKREEPRISTRAVASRPAHTINLREIEPNLNVENVADAVVARMIEEVSETRGCTVLEMDERDVDASRVKEVEDRMREWEWIFGRTPGFEARIGSTPSIEVGVKHGVIEDVIDTGGFEASHLLAGRRFEREALLDALESAPGSESVASIVRESTLL